MQNVNVTNYAFEKLKKEAERPNGDYIKYKKKKLEDHVKRRLLADNHDYFSEMEPDSIIYIPRRLETGDIRVVNLESDNLSDSAETFVETNTSPRSRSRSRSKGKKNTGQGTRKNRGRSRTPRKPQSGQTKPSQVKRAPSPVWKATYDKANNKVRFKTSSTSARTNKGIATFNKPYSLYEIRPGGMEDKNWITANVKNADVALQGLEKAKKYK